MNYIQRTLERKFLKANQAFKAILVKGARQVGKTTMLRHLAAQENRVFVTLDDPKIRHLAKTDPGLFFQMYKPPILIEEIQKAPELFDYIKILCDSTSTPGLFWLTGSESRNLRACAEDSLAGRIGILHMYSLSLQECRGHTNSDPIQFSLDALRERENTVPPIDVYDLFAHIWRGGMPGTLEYDDEQRGIFYDSYVENYLMRDAVEDNGISDTEGFRQVLRACAAFIGQQVNYTDIAQAGNVSIPTAKNWIKILQSMGIVFLLEPYSNNALKRLVKTPKLYFCDTGLAAHLSRWTSRDVLLNGAASGHYFENHVVGELWRRLAYGFQNANMTYYRDSNQKEIDVVLEVDGVIHPIEIKMASNPESRIVKRFRLLEKSGEKIQEGWVVCMSENVFPIDKMNFQVPVRLL